MNKLLIITGVCLIAIVCILKFYKPKKSSKESITTTDTVSYYPLTDALTKEIDNVLKTPYYIYKKTEWANGKKDSVSISTKEFEALAKPMLNFNLNTKENKDQFKETIFEDLSTQSITFMYAPKQVDAYISNITVLLNNENNLFKSVYIKTNQPQKDSSINIQYYWKSNKSITITKIVDYAKALNKKSLVEKQYVCWNDK